MGSELHNVIRTYTRVVVVGSAFTGTPRALTI